MTKPVAVILSGCGVYDGSEIHESVLTLLALNKRNMAYQCLAPNIMQYHVINHTNGNEMPESRNVLVEAARIARGNIKSIDSVNATDFSAIVIPGGFGAAKNLTTWAFKGPQSQIDDSVKNIISEAINNKIPLVAMCMAPVVVAKTFENSDIKPQLSVGNTTHASPYDIAAISNGMKSLGAQPQMVNVTGFCFDSHYKIITSPCYMMEASISEVFEGIENSIEKLSQLLN